MALLTRAQIDAALDLDRMIVSVPEWGGDVAVRVLTVGERLQLENKSETESRADAVVRLVALAMVGDDGRPLYGEDGIQALAAKSTVAFFRVRDAALRINRLTSDDMADIEKN
jgi:hypothetical protein